MNPLRPNVLIALLAGAGLTALFGSWLIDRIDTPVSSEILAMLVGIGIGGLFALAGALAQPESAPAVPASTHERDMNQTLAVLASAIATIERLGGKREADGA